MTSILSIINSKGPILTSKLIEEMKLSGSTSTEDAIRKQLSRFSHDDIFKLRGYFSHRQTLFYNKDDFYTDAFSERLRDALKSDAKQYHYLITALEFHHGVISKQQFAAYSVNPLINVKGHVTFDSAIEKLKSLSLIAINGDDIKINEQRSPILVNNRQSMAIQLAKDILLLQFNDWARNIALTTYHASSFYSDFGNFCFAFVAPSYVSTITSWSNKVKKPGFLVADIIIGNTITSDQVEFFIKKTDILKSQKNTPKFLPFLIVDSIDQSALNLLKSNGVIIGFVNNLFGKEYTELMKSLINTVVNAGAILKRNPEQFIDLLIKLKALVSGKTNNLRGDLFEMAVGYYHSKMGCGTLDIGKIINHEGSQREMDVYAVYGNKIVVSECKGYNYPMTKSDIESWLSDKIPVIRKWILQQPSLNDKEIHFQFWCTGGFDDDAQELIDRVIITTKKHTLEFFDSKKILKTSAEAKSKKFTDILNEYFIK